MLNLNRVFSRRFCWTFPSPDLDWESYRKDPELRADLFRDLEKREIDVKIRQNLKRFLEDSNISYDSKFSTIPNRIHPDVRELSEPRVVDSVAFEPKSSSDDKKRKRKWKSFDRLAETLSGCRTKNLASLCGERAYFLTSSFAEMERALIRYAVKTLMENHDFKLLSVPDILHPDIIVGCGMEVSGERTQVYRIEDENKSALSGTAEMGIGGYFLNKIVPSSKTLKRAAVSRCFRAEVSSTNAERGIYRVHNFTKVEMFAVTPPEESDSVLEEFLGIQRSLFDGLGLGYRVLDMSPDELGSPAYRKFDIEAYFPRKRYFGEISSCSNCTDYQSRRLNIKSEDGTYVHTVNGTAIAIPRIIMALVEQAQLEDGSIDIPEKLRPYLSNRTILSKDFERFPEFFYRESPNFFH